MPKMPISPPQNVKLTFMGYSHDDRPMFWANDGKALKIVYGEPVTEGIGLNVGDVVNG